MSANAIYFLVWPCRRLRVIRVMLRTAWKRLWRERVRWTARCHYVEGAALDAGPSSWSGRTQSERMAKAKRSKPREHLIRWRVSLIKGTETLHHRDADCLGRDSRSCADERSSVAADARRISA